MYKYVFYIFNLKNNINLKYILNLMDKYLLCFAQIQTNSQIRTMNTYKGDYRQRLNKRTSEEKTPELNMISLKTTIH